MSNEKLRITNTSAVALPPNGVLLDYKGAVIRPGRYTIVAGSMDEILEDWSQKGLVQIQNAEDGQVMNAPAQNTISAGTQLNEASAAKVLDDMEEDEIDFDPDSANEAMLPQSPALSGDLAQDQRRAKVSLGMEVERVSNGGLSPIPGDQPRNVDNADKFTIKAPRQTGPGAVIR